MRATATRGQGPPCWPALTLDTLCSFGGPPVLTGRQRGRGLAARTGAIPIQPRNRPECGWGGEAHQAPWGFWKVCSNLGREVLCPGKADDGERPLDAGGALPFGSHGQLLLSAHHLDQKIHIIAQFLETVRTFLKWLFSGSRSCGECPGLLLPKLLPWYLDLW